MALVVLIFSEGFAINHKKLRWQIKDRSIKDDLGDKADKEVPEKSKLKFLGILSAWQMTNRLTKSV